MRTIITTLLVSIFTFVGIVTSAQGVEIDCGDDVLIQDGIDLQFLNVSAQDVHYVTAVGIGEFDPVLAVFNQQQFGSCNDDSLEAEDTSAQLPTTEDVFPSSFSSFMEFSNNTFMRVVVGELDNIDGEAIVIVEGLTMDGEPDRIDVIVTERMIESQIPLSFYALPVTENLNLNMALVDDNGVPILDNDSLPVECDDAGENELCWGAHVPLLDAYTNVSDTRITEGTEISPMLSVPLTPDDVGTIVPLQIDISPLDAEAITGEYVFVMHYGVGEVGLADGLAEVSENDAGMSVSCDEIPILTNPIDITIPQLDSTVTVHLMAQSFVNPVMFEMVTDTRGTCYIIDGIEDEQFADLPIAGVVNPSQSNTSADIITESARLLTGLANDDTGSYVVAIDGLSLPPGDESNIVSVAVTEAMVASGEPVIAYMLARDTNLDPRLTLVSAEQDALVDNTGATITCGHTTLPDECWGDYEDMANASVTLGLNNSVEGISSDVMLTIPLSDEMIGTALNFMATGDDDSFGEYVILIHLTSGSPDDDEPDAEETETPDSSGG